MKLNPILEVEASITDKDGRPTPLTGQTFYILEKSPLSILRASDPSSEIAYAKTTDALRNMAIAFVITDTQGKTEITKLKTGTYYICGISRTAQQATVWNVEIELLPGKNKLVLNKENMLRT